MSNLAILTTTGYFSPKETPQVGVMAGVQKDLAGLQKIYAYN